jgi:hypothetical protein
VSSDSSVRLVVGQQEDRQLHVYSGEGSHVTSINLLDGDTLHRSLCGHLVVTLCMLLDE